MIRHILKNRLPKRFCSQWLQNLAIRSFGRHRIDVGPDEDLTDVVVYAPPGPEQQLKKSGARAFDK